MTMSPLHIKQIKEYNLQFEQGKLTKGMLQLHIGRITSQYKTVKPILKSKESGAYPLPSKQAMETIEKRKTYHIAKHEKRELHYKRFQEKKRFNCLNKIADSQGLISLDSNGKRIRSL
jgi:hypothetical protein